MVGTLIPLLLAMMILGFPIFIAMLIPSFISLNNFFPHINTEILVQQMFGGVDVFTLLAIPFFMFAADIISKGQIGKRLIDFANSIVGYFPGGLAIVTVATCMFFGAISGAGAAAVVSIGTLVYPELVRKGYSRAFSMGLILSSSTLAMLIPPGIAMILYCMLNPVVSVAKMFAGGMAAGLIMGLAYMLFSVGYALYRGIPREKFKGFKYLANSLYRAIWALGLPVIILLGVYSGIATVTEAAAVAVIYAIIVEMFIYKDLNLKGLYGIAVKSGKTIAMILVLISAGKVLSYLMTVANVPQMLTSTLGSYSPVILLLLINVIFLIAGMFVDPNSAIIVLTPLVVPITAAIGVDPIHLGVIIVVNLAIGMISPPFAMNIFVAQGVFKIPYGEIVRGVIPFIVISVIVLMLVSYLPEIVMWLPKLLS